MEEYEADDALASAALNHSVGGELCACRPDDRSLRHLVSGLFADHILGEPIRPVWVGLPSLFLVLSVLLCGAYHRLSNVARRRIRRVACSAPGKPLRNFSCLNNSRHKVGGLSPHSPQARPNIGAIVVA
jgi:hypothetical protein